MNLTKEDIKERTRYLRKYIFDVKYTNIENIMLYLELNQEDSIMIVNKLKALKEVEQEHDLFYITEFGSIKYPSSQQVFKVNEILKLLTKEKISKKLSEDRLSLLVESLDDFFSHSDKALNLSETDNYVTLIYITIKQEDAISVLFNKPQQEVYYWSILTSIQDKLKRFKTPTLNVFCPTENKKTINSIVLSLLSNPKVTKYAFKVFGNNKPSEEDISVHGITPVFYIPPITDLTHIRKATPKLEILKINDQVKLTRASNFKKFIRDSNHTIEELGKFLDYSITELENFKDGISVITAKFVRDLALKFRFPVSKFIQSFDKPEFSALYFFTGIGRYNEPRPVETMDPCGTTEVKVEGALSLLNSEISNDNNSTKLNVNLNIEVNKMTIQDEKSRKILKSMTAFYEMDESKFKDEILNFFMENNTNIMQQAIQYYFQNKYRPDLEKMLSEM